ncbi:NADH:ubiquinone oxidoreductase [Coemansia erecta]|uniref:NADH:ubiquinone oxidoreductase n=1 Tax=Coemansia erecta TaxID=147472 RepID=A0A9W7XY32_9FUNG|nr:NADH:ubiquinone oxidoreductase [Coemansia erecta]
MAMDMRERYMDKELELEEFQVQSGELEAELESEIARLESALAELRARNEKYKHDIEDLKEKYQRVQLKAGEDLASIERELQFVRSQQEYYKSRTRDLEQTNDDLERNERAAKSSLQAMECKLSRAVEENTHLMGEVNTKKVLVDEVQRLKDELKDLNLELNVVRSRNSRAVPQSSGMSKSTANADFGGGENPALMVHNIMSRVKDLESRLAGARTKVTPLIGANGQYATLHSRITRGRNIANPKTGSTASGDLPQKSATVRGFSSVSNGESRISGSSLADSRMERTRAMQEIMRKRKEEEALRQQQQQQTVPQRRPLV